MIQAEQVLKLLDNTSDSSGINFKDQKFARPQVVADIISQAQMQIKAKIPDIQKAMKLYLGNKETEFILFKPIKVNITR